MATKHDEFKVYYFSFDEDELRRVVSALRVNGDDELADEITEEIYDECGDCDCGDPIGKLTIDIDYISTNYARDELNKLKDAVDALADSYDVLNKAASLGTTTTGATIDATDRLIKEFLDLANNERGHYLDILSQFMNLKRSER